MLFLSLCAVLLLGSAPALAETSGTVLAAGSDTYHQCDVSAWTGITQVATGMFYTVGLKTDGTVVAAGLNGYGKCNVSGWTDVMQVAAGKNHTVAVKADGTVVAVGDDSFHQCDVYAWSGISQVAAGMSHTVGRRTDGRVVAVGDNTYGQCNVSGWTGITQVAAGRTHTVGLRADGRVVAIGRSYYGECNVSGWSDIVQVAAGDQYTLGLKADGTVVAVGKNSSGQCDVSAWKDIVQVAAVDQSSAALEQDGTVLSSAYQVGVDGWTSIAQVAVGWDHIVGIKDNQEPVADAGPDQTVEQTSPAGAVVTLDGSASYDPNGDELTYTWKLADQAVASDARSLVLLPPGLTEVVLVASDGEYESEDSVLITVADTTPPAITAVPEDIALEATGPDGAQVCWPAPAATDTVDGEVAVLSAPSSGDVFPLGVTTVTLVATDAAGNTDTAQFLVEVIPATAEGLGSLIEEEVLSGLVDVRIEGALLAKVDAVVAALARDDPTAVTVALNGLQALVNQVEAQSGKKISADAAAAIVAKVEALVVALES